MNNLYRTILQLYKILYLVGNKPQLLLSLLSHAHIQHKGFKRHLHSLFVLGPNHFFQEVDDDSLVLLYKSFNFLKTQLMPVYPIYEHLFY